MFCLQIFHPTVQSMLQFSPLPTEGREANCWNTQWPNNLPGRPTEGGIAEFVCNHAQSFVVFIKSPVPNLHAMFLSMTAVAASRFSIVRINPREQRVYPHRPTFPRSHPGAALDKRKVSLAAAPHPFITICQFLI